MKIPAYSGAMNRGCRARNRTAYFELMRLAVYRWLTPAIGRERAALISALLQQSFDLSYALTAGDYGLLPTAAIAAPRRDPGVLSMGQSPCVRGPVTPVKRRHANFLRPSPQLRIAAPSFTAGDFPRSPTPGRVSLRMVQVVCGLRYRRSIAMRENKKPPLGRPNRLG